MPQGFDSSNFSHEKTSQEETSQEFELELGSGSPLSFEGDHEDEDRFQLLWSPEHDGLGSAPNPMAPIGPAPSQTNSREANLPIDFLADDPAPMAAVAAPLVADAAPAAVPLAAPLVVNAAPAAAAAPVSKGSSVLTSAVVAIALAQTQAHAQARKAQVQAEIKAKDKTNTDAAMEHTSPSPKKPKPNALEDLAQLASEQSHLPKKQKKLAPALSISKSKPAGPKRETKSQQPAPRKPPSQWQRDKKDGHLYFVGGNPSAVKLRRGYYLEVVKESDSATAKRKTSTLSQEQEGQSASKRARV